MATVKQVITIGETKPRAQRLWQMCTRPPQGQVVEAGKMCAHPAFACQMKVRRLQPSSPNYLVVASARETLAEQAAILYYTSQMLYTSAAYGGRLPCTLKAQIHHPLGLT